MAFTSEVASIPGPAAFGWCGTGSEGEDVCEFSSGRYALCLICYYYCFFFIIDIILMLSNLLL